MVAFSGLIHSFSVCSTWIYLNSARLTWFTTTALRSWFKPQFCKAPGFSRISAVQQGLPTWANLQHEHPKACVGIQVCLLRRPLALLASASSTSHRPRPLRWAGRAAARQLADSDLGRRRRQRRSATGPFGRLSTVHKCGCCARIANPGSPSYGCTEQLLHWNNSKTSQRLIVRGCFLGRNKGTGTYC